jgi:hypothetical protein
MMERSHAAQSIGQKPDVPPWEPRNKIMRIGLHGLCGYIKLERGRNGGADGAIAAQRSRDQQP